MRSRIEWIMWGKTDPLYGVASWPGREKTGENPWTEQEFYATGESEWKDFLSQWSQYGFDPHCCIEIGCGAGRLTGQLTGCFRKVYAIDISPDVIELARRHAPEATYYVTDGETLPVADGSATAVFSTFVFRHFDRLSDAIIYFREMHRVLVPGGCMMIEFPIYNWPTKGTFFKFFYRLRKKVGDLRADFLRYWIRKGWCRPIVRELQYEIGWLCRTVEAIGFTEIEVRVFHLAINQSRHSFLFARRAPAQN
ncbi:MAG: class I SAM-dependent methyltransferase [Acidobacteria bacterium]|nr:class I SAM-dependent methyltransferase [Acidobacteriota bacterium]